MPRLIDDAYLEHYKTRGVPGSVLYGIAPEDIKEHITRINYTDNKIAKSINPVIQREYFKKMQESTKPFLTIIAGLTDDTLACQCGLLMCAQMLAVDAQKKFYWHLVTGGYRDKVRDDEVLADDVNTCNLLVISNISKNSTNNKIEKVKDAVELYSHIPRIVIVSGTDPIDFCTQVLYTKPRYVVYFGR